MIRGIGQSLLIGMILAALGGTTMAQTGASEPQWAPDLSAMLIHVQGNRSALLDRNSFNLDTLRVKVESGASLEGLLKANGIFYDADAVTAVFNLNPDMKAAEISPGSEILLPVVRGNSEIKQSLRQGDLVAITLDVELKRNLMKARTRLESLVPRVVIRWENNPKTKDAAQAIASIDEGVATISQTANAKTSPIPSEMLFLAVKEAEYVERILESVDSTGRDLTSEEMDAIKSVSEHMNALMVKLAKPMGGDDKMQNYLLPVVVKVINRAGEEVQRLRVYYDAFWAPEGYENIRELNGLTSPVFGSLIFGRYRIWAGEPGDPIPLTDRATPNIGQLEIAGPDTVVLLLKKQ